MNILQKLNVLRISINSCQALYFRFTSNMDSSVMELLDAHDILRPGHINEQILKDFLFTLRDFQSLSTCDQKKLQVFSSSVNNCLNSQSHKDKYYGLCALEVLLQQCPSEFLQQNIGSYINSVVNQVFKIFPGCGY